MRSAGARRPPRRHLLHTLRRAVRHVTCLLPAEHGKPPCPARRIDCSELVCIV